MRLATTFCAAAACLVCAANAADTRAAEAELTPDTSISSVLRLPIRDFHPVTAADLSARRADVLQAVGKLDDYLSRDPAINAGWQRYLRTADLHGELDRGVAADPQVLREIARQYAGGHEGLELPQYAAIREALARYIAALAVAQDPDQAAWLERQSGRLVDLLDGYTKAPSSEASNEIALLLTELRAAAPATADELRQPIDRPNLFIRASAAYMAAAMTKEIDENNANFTDNILGTAVFGTTQTHGNQTAVLIDSSDRALIEIQLFGKTTSDTTGVHPPVTIHSNGTTQFTGAVRIAMGPDGSVASLPAAWACTHTNIDSICVCGGRLVRRIATRRVYESKPEAECIAAQHAERLVRERIRNDADYGVREQNDNYQEKLIKPLSRWNAVPEMHYSSTPAAIFITARESGPDQLGASSDPPSLDGDPMLGLRIHESFINNMTAKTLGGRTIKREEFVKGYRDIFGEDKSPPGEESDQQLGREWEITYAKEKPVGVHFADNGFTVTIRATHFHSKSPVEETEIDYPWTISAAYTIEGKSAKRIGPIKIESTGGNPTPAQHFRHYAQLHTRFEKMLKETFEFEGLEFMKGPLARAGKLVSSQVVSDKGWLTVGWSKEK